MIISDGNPGEMFVIRGPMINSDSHKISDMAFLDNVNGYDISKTVCWAMCFLHSLILLYGQYFMYTKPQLNPKKSIYYGIWIGPCCYLSHRRTICLGRWYNVDEAMLFRTIVIVSSHHRTIDCLKHMVKEKKMKCKWKKDRIISDRPMHCNKYSGYPQVCGPFLNRFNIIQHFL